MDIQGDLALQGGYVVPAARRKSTPLPLLSFQQSGEEAAYEQEDEGEYVTETDSARQEAMQPREYGEEFGAGRAASYTMAIDGDNRAGEETQLREGREDHKAECSGTQCSAMQQSPVEKVATPVPGGRAGSTTDVVAKGQQHGIIATKEGQSLSFRVGTTANQQVNLPPIAQEEEALLHGDRVQEQKIPHTTAAFIAKGHEAFDLLKHTDIIKEFHAHSTELRPSVDILHDLTAGFTRLRAHLASVSAREQPHMNASTQQQASRKSRVTTASKEKAQASPLDELPQGYTVEGP